MTVYPSIASANQANLAGELQRIGDHPYLHFDIEDGNFVPNITFGLKTIAALCPLTSAAFDAHLMVTNPQAYIPQLQALGFSAIAFHWEAAAYPMQIIHAIRDGGCRAGVALNPRTTAEAVLAYLPEMDYVLVMTAELDGHGDAFQPHVLEKIHRLRAAAPELCILADGGIDQTVLPDVRRAGASGVVLGRAVFSADDPAAAIWRFSNM